MNKPKEKPQIFLGKGPRLFVKIREGGIVRKLKVYWREVALEEVSVSCYQKDIGIHTPYGVFHTGGLEVNMIQVAHILGVPIGGEERAEAIWKSPTAIGNSEIRLDFAIRELVQHPPRFNMAFPFSCFSAVSLVGEPSLVAKPAAEKWLWPPETRSEGRIVIGSSFPIPAVELAERMGLPTLDA